MRLSEKERQKLVDANVPFVRSIAGRIKEQLPREIEFDDLYNYGMAGLLEAADRYDRRHGVSFTTFAYYRVRGAVFDGLRAMGWLPRTEYSKVRVEERAAAYLQNLAERDLGAGASELPDEVNVDEEVRTIAEALGGVAAIFVTSLEAQQKEASDTPAGTTAAPQLHVEAQQEQTALEIAIEALPEKERRLLQMYYFEDKPLEEAGKVLGLSKSWSSRLHARAVDLLKEELARHGITAERMRRQKPRARR